MTDGIVNIRGKQYHTVAKRVGDFRAKCSMSGGWGIVTQLVSLTDDAVVMRASIVLDGVELATGYAEEVRSASQINRTSALENAETSAIGRALAAAGFGGTEYASADEVQNALLVDAGHVRYRVKGETQGSSGSSKQEQQPPGSRTDSAKDGDIIARIREIVSKSGADRPGKALANYAKSRGAQQWTDLSSGELAELHKELTKEGRDARAFLNSQAGQ